MPLTVYVQRDGGNGDMGDVDAIGAQDTTVGRVARFFRPKPFYLSWVRVHFSGSGSGTATLTLKLDNAHGELWDATLWTWTGAGIGAADVFFRIPLNELEHWLFQDGDELCFEWTNPDAGNINWGIETGLIDATQ
ncbi:MAG: hypothetical protein KAV00_02030 [Phycisphaerae bacterium]|nr:hypothetical protein [Phycisphaerae bacterium]